MRAKLYWFCFVLFQVGGFASLTAVNVHSNFVAPMFFAFVLLLPGGILILFSPGLPFAATACIIVALNFLTWFALQRFGGTELSRTR